jgi:hypothetical protein
MMPDGTTMKELVVTGEEVFVGHWEAYRSGIEEELGRTLTEDEYDAVAINFAKLLRLRKCPSGLLSKWGL